MSGRFYNSEAYFFEVRLDESGFREYDARWVIEPLKGSPDDDVQLNYRGLTVLGKRLGQFLARPENGAHDRVLVGHDFRRYAENAKNALVLGLLASGLDVVDAGLCLSPTLYFGQHAYEIPACAMLTASHNPNGWTGVKMGHDYSLTFGPDRMAAFRDLVRREDPDPDPPPAPGRHSTVTDLRERYLQDLVGSWSERLDGAPRFPVAVETGNGTAGAFLPELLERLGFEVVRGHTELDWDFPNFNPDPESVPFLRSVQTLVRENGAEVGICADGDGDRLGVIDDRGRIVFSDRVGLILARKLETLVPDAKFVVDVKSTSLYTTHLHSPVVWEKAGHSYIKSRLAQERATAGFERSGHFFFAPPFGRGYDDACISALMVLWAVAEARRDGGHLSTVVDALPASHQSPNRQPRVPEARKYEIVEEIRRRIEDEVARDGTFAGVAVEDLVTINGVRVEFADASWLLVRASSNTPNLVIVAESFDENGDRLRALDAALREVTRGVDGIGEFEPLYEG